MRFLVYIIFSFEESQSSKIEESLLKPKVNEDEGANSFMNLLLVNCLGALLSLYSAEMPSIPSPGSDKDNSPLARQIREFWQQKTVYLKSLKRDYRLISLFSLYKQAEINIEHSAQPLLHQFADSLASLRLSLKAFIDDCLEV